MNHSERIVYDYAAGRLGYEEAIYQITRLGLSSREAETLLNQPRRQFKAIQQDRQKEMQELCPELKRKKRYHDFIVSGFRK